MKNTWIELDLGILSANLSHLRQALGAQTQIVFVVKADAYGHGLLPVAERAWLCGVEWFAVAHMDEAMALRARLPQARILVLGAIAAEDAVAAARADLVPVLVNQSHAVRLAAGAAAANVTLRCHAKIDTGMGRLGFDWEEAGRLLPMLACLQGLRIEGICTHFASADNRASKFADEQAARLQSVIEALRTAGITALFCHASNSGAIRREAQWDLDGVRPGIMLYGYGPKAEPTHGSAGRRIDTRPFLQWKTRVLQIKPVDAGFPVSYDSTYVTPSRTHIATIDAGYSDGYPRLIGNRGYALVGGRRCPVVGRVTMNFTMLDIGPRCDIREGDEVVLLGQQGTASLWADEIAGWCQTISYEVLTNIRTDVRVLVDRDEGVPSPTRGSGICGSL
jgi:alanine racemase